MTNTIVTDDFGLTSVSLEELAAELFRIGDDEFKKKYPCAFLILMEGPPEDQDWMDIKTGEGSSPQLMSLDLQSMGLRAVALQKSDRNVFDSKVLVGRARNNDIVIRAPKVSKLHCAFVKDEDGSYSLTDMGSRNGSTVNGKRLKTKEQKRLNNGDTIVFWRYVFSFEDRETIIEKLRKFKLDI